MQLMCDSRITLQGLAVGAGPEYIVRDVTSVQTVTVCQLSRYSAGSCAPSKPSQHRTWNFDHSLPPYPSHTATFRHKPDTVKTAQGIESYELRRATNSIVNIMWIMEIFFTRQLSLYLYHIIDVRAKCVQERTNVCDMIVFIFEYLC